MLLLLLLGIFITTLFFALFIIISLFPSLSTNDIVIIENSI